MGKVRWQDLSAQTFLIGRHQQVHRRQTEAHLEESGQKCVGHSAHHPVAPRRTSHQGEAAPQIGNKVDGHHNPGTRQAEKGHPFCSLLAPDAEPQPSRRNHWTTEGSVRLEAQGGWTQDPGRLSWRAWRLRPLSHEQLCGSKSRLGGSRRGGATWTKQLLHPPAMTSTHRATAQTQDGGMVPSRAGTVPHKTGLKKTLLAAHRGGELACSVGRTPRPPGFRPVGVWGDTGEASGPQGGVCPTRPGSWHVETGQQCNPPPRPPG